MSWLEADPAATIRTEPRCAPRWKKRNFFAPCMRGRAPSSSRTPGTPVRQSCSPRSASRALATTSLGLANMLGSATVTRDAIIENCRMIAGATDLPVNADLENCGADEPKAAAKTIALAAEAGAVGGSIEDATGDLGRPIYDFALAVERVHAAVEVARSLPIPFMLTARAESLLYGSNDLDDIIRRLQAFEAAGADVLYAPGVRDLAQIRTVVSALKKL